MNGTPSDDHERFARAVEARTGPPDPEFARELAVVEMLRTLGTQPAVPTGSRTRIAARIRAGMRRNARRAFVLGTGLCVLVGLLPAVLLARDTLPGDALYELKRAGERAELVLDGDPGTRARSHLEFAARRVTELSALVRQPGADPAHHRRALADFSTEAATGTAMLTPVATNSDGRQLRWLRGWARGQSARLRALVPALPAPADAALSVLTRIDARANALWRRMPCVPITSGRTDELGDIPAGGDCGEVRERARSVPAQRTGRQRARLPEMPAARMPATEVSQVPLRRHPPRPRSGSPLPSVPSVPSVPSPSVPASPSPAYPEVVGEPELAVPLPVRLAELPPLLPGMPRVTVGG